MMLMWKRRNVLGQALLIAMFFFYSCEKEVSSDGLVERNGLTYEVNSETPFSGKSVEYFDGGDVIHESISYQDGLRHGSSIEWYENGQIKMEMKFKDGLESGETNLWYENGQLWAETSWENGKINGTFMSWRENGQPDTEEHYKNDSLQGTKKTWHENGQLATESKFENGELDGIFNRWYENGVLAETGKFKSGQKVGAWTYRDQDGQIGVLDIDGNVYKTVVIGDQVWMAENLKVTHYRDGDPISKDVSKYFWMYTSNGSYCNYDNNEDKADSYGALYNWFAIEDSRNIAPEGWHVATDEEWKQLEVFLGMDVEEANESEGIGRGSNIGAKLKTTNIWSKDDDGLQNGTNESGFSALPAGYRTSQGDFLFEGFTGNFWTASENGKKYAWDRSLTNWYTTINRNYADKESGMSVRCVKD